MRRGDRVVTPSGRPGGERPPGARSRTVLILLLLMSFTVVTLDARPSGDSPVDALRTAADAVFGPLETGAATAVAPITGLRRSFGDVEELRAATDRLERVNEDLRSQLRATQFTRHRAAELDRLLGVAAEQGHRLVPAQVTAVGAAQTFSRTVTIDAGRVDGVRPDMTVLNGEGLVGRVIAASRSSASVLLLIDRDSVVGGRLGRTMELGFVTGDGDIGDHADLRLELLDRLADPADGDAVVTWGSRDGAPYVAGVPIGAVTQVLSSPRELSKTVVIEPYVDFSSLDLVGVVASANGRGGGQAAAGGSGRP